MLRSLVGKQQKTIHHSCPLLIFSIGGRRLAVKTNEVAGISQWKGSIPVPGHTPFVSSIMRRDRQVYPVFNLADMLHVSVQGDQLLCLTVKHPDGAMAVCIDEEMPVLHTLATSAIQIYHGGELAADGCFINGFDEIPIIAVSKLASV